MRTFPYFHKLFAAPLLLLPSVRSGMEFDLLSLLSMDRGVVALAPQAAAAEGEKMHWRVASIYQSFGSVDVLQISGTIDKHISDSDMACYGGLDLNDVDSALTRASMSPAERVVIAFNSPGGSSMGVPETAQRIAKLRQTKEVHSFVDGYCCSGAQWLAAQADKTVMTPSSWVGSIGVYMAVLDATRALELEGYRVELIKAGKWKAMGAPFKSLTDDERGLLQMQVDDLFSEFRAAVRTGRGRKIADSTMEGQVILAKDAVDLGLVDEVTTSNLDEYVATLLSV